MKRLLLNLFTALSLLAFVLSAVGWVVGERRAWQFTYRRIDDEGRRTGDVSAWSWRGSLVVQAGKLERPHAGEAAVREPPPGPRHYDRWRGRPTMTPMDPDADRFGGFALTTYGYTFWPYPPTSPGPYAPTSVMNQVVMVPWYAILLVTAAVPLLRLRRAMRNRRRPGGCAACGYDLTGNVSGVCPECGAASGAVRG